MRVCACVPGPFRVSIPRPFALLGRILKEAPSQRGEPGYPGEGVDPGGREAWKSSGASGIELARNCTTFRISEPLVSCALRTCFTERSVMTVWIPSRSHGLIFGQRREACGRGLSSNPGGALLLEGWGSDLCCCGRGLAGLLP